MSATIKDVARLAGISYTTVSHVINGTRAVLPQTRQRVQQAMQQCGYVPSAVARSLRLARSGLVGMVVPDISDPFSSELAKGAEEVASQAELALVLCDLGQDPQWQQKKLHRLLAQRVDGMIAVAGLSETLPVSELLQQRLSERVSLPLVTIDHGYPDVLADVLMTDQHDLARQAVNHLVSLGHRAIACLPGPGHSQLVQARVRGWRSAMRSNLRSNLRSPVRNPGQPEPAQAVRHGDFGVEYGHRAVMDLLHAGPSPAFSALVVSTHAVAAGAMRALKERGWRVPQDVSVVVMDGGPLAPYSLPSLTSVDRDVRAMGRLAMQRLLARIREPQMPARQIVVKAQLSVRESSGPVAPARA